MDTPQDALPQEDKEVEVAVEQEIAPEAEPEAPIKEVLTDSLVKSDAVPLAIFLKEKSERKELEKRIEDLQKQVNKGNVSDVSDEIKALGDEYGVDNVFLGRLTTIMETRVASKAGEMTPEVKKLLEEHQAKELDGVFQQHYQKALTRMPEYADVANAGVIKALTLLPENANKTFSQIIEEAYGRSITGKKTIETTTPGGGKEPESIDYDKAKNDDVYLDGILSDPIKKAEYNKDLAKRLSI